MNIADDEPIEDFVHPPEGDVLWAIGNFSRRLGDPSAAVTDRAEALRFLVHFVVDIHQPLHVGLEEDRGGNSVRIRYEGAEENLHRFWDTLAVRAAGISINADSHELVAGIGDASDPASLDPAVWAAESQRLRSQVYAFRRAGEELPAAYVDRATGITRHRLGQAALRLAGTLNAVFACD